MKTPFLIIIFFISSMFVISAQDLEPRFLSSVPLKTNLASFVYGYSTGNILLDNSLPIEDLNAKAHSFVFVYIRSFKLFNKLAKVDVTLPYSTAKFNGLLDGEAASTSRNGLGDPSARISIILIGEEALDLKEFSQRTVQKFKLGVAFKTRLPLGEYNNSKLINLGSNRWGFHLKTAASYQISKKVIIEGHTSVWFFTKNDSFFPDSSLQQEPLFGAQINTAYIFNPGMWMSVALGAVSNGRTIINGVKKDNLQNNSRFGFTFSYKVNRTNNLKFIATNGLLTNVGADFTTYLLAYTYIWMGK